MRMYLYENSRNVQEPWPPDLYFTVHWLQTLARLSLLRFLSKVESQDLLMVASWYFIWGCISIRPPGICKSHDLLAYISQSTDFILLLHSVYSLHMYCTSAEMHLLLCKRYGPFWKRGVWTRNKSSDGRRCYITESSTCFGLFSRMYYGKSLGK